MKFCRVAVIVCLIAVNVSAQDPFKVAPQAYKLQFENESVKVVRVHYAPREKIASHDHPKRGTIYVYLKDGGPVRFIHVGSEPYSLVRPPIKANGFRLARAVTESHEVENLSDITSDYLRIELMTDPVDDKSFRGRFPLEPHAQDKSFQKVAFENEQVRIVRVFCAADQTFNVTKNLSLPALLVAFSPVQFKVTKNGRTNSRMELGMGETKWLEGASQEPIIYSGKQPVELPRIEFKTKPARL